MSELDKKLDKIAYPSTGKLAADLEGSIQLPKSFEASPQKITGQGPAQVEKISMKTPEDIFRSLDGDNQSDY